MQLLYEEVEAQKKRKEAGGQTEALDLTQAPPRIFGRDCTNACQRTIADPQGVPFLTCAGHEEARGRDVT